MVAQEESEQGTSMYHRDQTYYPHLVICFIYILTFYQTYINFIILNTYTALCSVEYWEIDLPDLLDYLVKTLSNK